MHALSLVELGLCYVRPPHRFAPRGAGEKRAAGNGPAGAGAGQGKRRLEIEDVCFGRGWVGQGGVVPMEEGEL